MVKKGKGDGVESFQAIFILPTEEVTLQIKNHLKKAYRYKGYEVHAVFHGPHFFDQFLTMDQSEQMIVCMAFDRQLFMPMVEWIERHRRSGFKGRIVLSISEDTFDYDAIPKFLACGGSYIIKRDEWMETPTRLIIDKHDDSVLTWLHNQHHKKEIELVNDEALEYLYDELLNKEKIPMETLSFVYNGLNKSNKKELLTLLQKRIRCFGSHILHQPSISGISEGIITIWDNAEFCCELGTRIALETQKKVLIIDLDRLNPTFDMYCPKVKGKKRNGHLGDVQRLFNASKLTDESLNALCSEAKGISTLKILFGCSDLKKFEYFTNEALLEAIARFQKTFDVVLINVNQFIYDAYTCLGLIKSDYVLIPVDGKITSVRNYQRAMNLLCEKQQISLEKFQYVFFNCEEMFSGEVQLLSELLHGPILGWISSCKKRRYYRNLKRAYAEVMPKTVDKEYASLIGMLIR